MSKLPILQNPYLFGNVSPNVKLNMGKDLLILTSKSGENLRISNNGDFYINGKFIDNDKLIVSYFKNIVFEEHTNNIKNQVRNNPELYQSIITELRIEKIERLRNK